MAKRQKLVTIASSLFLFSQSACWGARWSASSIIQSRVRVRKPQRSPVRRCLAGWLLAVALPSCSPTPIALNHSPQMASNQAERFAETALVRRDIHKAYELLSDSGKNRVSEGQLKNFIVGKHPTTFPLFFTATGFRPVPGKRLMEIYLLGKNGDEEFYYRFLMEGVIETGYKVIDFDRGRVPFSQSNIRPI